MPPVNCRWTGAVDGDVNDAGNWDDGAGGAGSVPVATDHVYFTYGSVDCNINLATLAAVTLGSFTRSLSYTGSIGDSTPTYLQCKADNVWYAAPANATDYLDIDVSASGMFVIDSTGVMLYMRGDQESVCANGGNITVNSGAWTDEVYIGREANVVFESGCTLTGLSAMRMVGGIVNCSVAIADLILTNGTWYHMLGNVTGLQQFGGMFSWQAPGTTITTAGIYAGLFDASPDPMPKTITTILMHNGSMVNLDNGRQNIVLTNPLRYYGGQLQLPKNNTVTI